MKCLICGNETENYICSDCRLRLREEYPEYSEYKAKLISFADRFEKDRRDFIIASILIILNQGNKLSVLQIMSSMT